MTDLLYEVAGYLFLGILPATLIIWLLRHRQGLVHVSEINLRVGFTLAVLASMFFYCLSFGVLLIVKYVAAPPANTGLAVAITGTVVMLTSLPLMAMVLYVRMRLGFTKDYSLTPVHDPELARRVAGLSMRLDLVPPPRLEESSHAIPPFVYGGLLHGYSLVVPTQFTQRVRAAASVANQPANDVLDFVLLHELSHIRHGDALLTSIAVVFSKPLLWWLGASAVFSLVLIALGQPGPLLVLLLIGSALLVVLVGLFPFSRHKEFLADARASLYAGVPGRRIDSGGGGDDFHWMTGLAAALTFPLPRVPALGFTSASRSLLDLASGPVRVAWVPWLLSHLATRTHPSTDEREQALREERVLTTNVDLPSLGAYAYMGLVSGVMFVFLSVFFSSSAELSVWFLDGTFPQGADRPPVSGLAAFSLVPAAITVCLPILSAGHRFRLLTPIKQMTAVMQRVGAFLLAYVPVMTLAFLAAWDTVPNHWDIARGVLGLSLFFLVLAATLSGLVALLSSLHNVSRALEEYVSPIHFYLWVIVILGTGLLGPFVAWRLTKITADPLIALLLDLIVTASVVSSLQGSRLFRWIDKRVERLAAVVPRKRALRYLQVHELISASSLPVIFSVLAIALSLPSLLFASIIQSAEDPGIITIAVLAALLPILFFRLGFKMKKDSMAQFWVSPAQVEGLATILASSRSKGLSQSQEILVTMQSAQAGDGYSLDPGQEATSALACYCVAKLTELLGSAPDERATRGVITLENRSGGFSTFSGFPPSLRGTLLATETLRLTSATARVDGVLHHKWIMNGFVWQAGGFCSPEHVRPNLKDTWASLRSIANLDMALDIPRSEITEFVKSRYEPTTRSVDQVYYAAMSLDLLGEMTEDIKSEIWHRVVLPYRSFADSLDLRDRLTDIKHYTELFALLATDGSPLPPKQVERLQDWLTMILTRPNPVVRRSYR